MAQGHSGLFTVAFQLKKAFSIIVTLLSLHKCISKCESQFIAQFLLKLYPLRYLTAPVCVKKKFSFLFWSKMTDGS